MLPAAGNDAQSALLLPESNSIQRVFSKGTASVAKGRDPFELYYEIHGSGPEKVVLIMGLANSLSSWSTVANYLLNHYPGYQRRWKERLSQNQALDVALDTEMIMTSTDGIYRRTTEMARDVLDLMDHLGWRRAHIVGISLGGMIAQELSFLLGPERMMSLSLLVTHAGGLRAFPPLTALWSLVRSGSIRDPAERAKYVFPNIYSKCPSLLRDSKWLQRYMEQKVPPGTTIFDLKRYMPPYDGPDAVTAFDVLRDDYIKRFQLDGYPAGAQLQVNAAATHYVSYARLEQLRQMQRPILVITSAADELISSRNSYLLRDALQPAEFIDLNDAGHAVTMECTEEVVEALVRNWKRNPSCDVNASSM